MMDAIELHFLRFLYSLRNLRILSYSGVQPLLIDIANIKIIDFLVLNLQNNQKNYDLLNQKSTYRQLAFLFFYKKIIEAIYFNEPISVDSRF